VSQRDSGYERKERDLYETPEWVTQALLPHLRGDVVSIWEPAAGTGKMSRVLAVDHDVYSSDINIDVGFLDGVQADVDFLNRTIPREFDAIITNPPYESAEEFIRRSIGLMLPGKGLVAMLLRTDYDHARTRQDLFVLPPFAKKVVLTKRIRWFEDSKGSPSFNHAWFIWDWKHSGPPTLAYGP
jgi:hypothetical protein